MSSWDGIDIRVESAGSAPDSWGNAVPILHEVLHALRRLAESGESTLIDVKSLPFGPGDEEQLLAALGEGEVRAKLDTLGESRIWESRYAGVWLVEHLNVDGGRVAFHIEITEVPQILCSQADDISAAVRNLETDLSDRS
jgi:hydrogenase-1 operon protein HyaF